MTLIGDALHTAHFSIGSGTRLAFEDAIALDRAFAQAGDNVAAALVAYEVARRPILEKIVAAANSSSFWCERMDDKMQYTPTQLAYDYMARSGRISDARLTEMASKFMAQVIAARTTEKNNSSIADPFDRNCAASKEIDFSVPEFYNCSRILYDNVAANRSEKTAIFCGDRSMTYGELCAAASRAGNGLSAMGLARSSRVLLLMNDTPEYIAAIFGAMRAGFVPVLLNTLSPAELIGFYAQDCGAEVAIVGYAAIRKRRCIGIVRKKPLRPCATVGCTPAIVFVSTKKDFISSKTVSTI